MTQQEKAEKIVELILRTALNNDEFTVLSEAARFSLLRRKVSRNGSSSYDLTLFFNNGEVLSSYSLNDLLLNETVAKSWFGEDLVCKNCGSKVITIHGTKFVPGFSHRILNCPRSKAIPAYKFHIARGAMNFALIDEYYNFRFRE